MTPREYAARLLRDVGCGDVASREELRPRETPSADRWVESGLLALTGFAAGPPVRPTIDLPAVADGAFSALRALVAEGAFASVPGGAELLTERASIGGLARAGRISAGGACRLLRAADEWIAASLPRQDDARSLAAWLEEDAFVGCSEVTPELWEAIALRVQRRSAAELVERARWLGLAVSGAVRPNTGFAVGWFEVAQRGTNALRESGVRPVVVDLSSLWAGPLAGRLLQLAGARVIKVESSRRPDGSRFGPPAFFERLNSGKENVQLDLGREAGCRELARLLDAADIVIEGSRPRALRQLGVDAPAWVGARAGRIWLSITGHGRRFEDAVAFGDDAAAAAGLCWCVPDGAAPLFVADAVADPLTGLHGALATIAHWKRGEGALLDLSLRAVTAYAIAHGGERSSA
jgi:hypothetical protein